MLGLAFYVFAVPVMSPWAWRTTRREIPVIRLASLAVGVAAATKALQSVALGLLEEHLAHCVTQALADGGDTAGEKVREASDAIARLVRS